MIKSRKTGRQTKAKTDGWTDRRTEGRNTVGESESRADHQYISQTDRQTNRQTDGLTVRLTISRNTQGNAEVRMSERTDRQTAGLTDGRMNR